jgi:hypothetical protein
MELYYRYFGSQIKQLEITKLADKFGLFSAMKKTVFPGLLRI